MMRCDWCLLASVLLCTLPMPAFSWTQQYGDPASTSYVDYTGPAYSIADWQYTTEQFVSQKSPSVNEEGVIFYPLRAYVVAIAPNGTQLWKTSVAPNGKAYLTNTVYSKERDLMVVGASWVEGHNFMQIVAVQAKSGKVVWTSKQDQLFHPTTISISTVANAVYCAGYEESTLTAVSLADGRTLWSKTGIHQVGIFMQTKVGPHTSTNNSDLNHHSNGTNSYLKHRGEYLEILDEAVLLPTDPYNGFDGNGTLFLFDVYPHWAHNILWPLWEVDLGFTAGGMFAFSPAHTGLIYGSNAGSDGNQGDIFIVDVGNGTVVYNDWGMCDREAEGTSGPAVDKEGNGYFSCGNQVFSVYPNGSLRWVSKQFGNSTLGITVAPSIHPLGKVFFIHDNHEEVYQLDTNDGGNVKIYGVPKLGYLEPPILLGTRMMYVVGFYEGSAIQIIPVKLDL